MMTWKYGREHLLDRVRGSSPPLEQFMGSLGMSGCQRVPGTAVFLSSTPDATPHALLHSLKHYKVLHEQNVFLTVEFAEVPWVGPEDHIECKPIVGGSWKVRARYGFMDKPEVAIALQECAQYGLKVEPWKCPTSSREQIVTAPMARAGAIDSSLP